MRVELRKKEVSFVDVESISLGLQLKLTCTTLLNPTPVFCAILEEFPNLNLRRKKMMEKLPTGLFQSVPLL